MMESIRPSADLRNHYSEISRLCRENRQPVYITVNGRGDTVLIGLAEYEQMRAELELRARCQKRRTMCARAASLPLKIHFPLCVRACL